MRLKGSEKQIKWANNIKESKIKEINEYRNRFSLVLKGVEQIQIKQGLSKSEINEKTQALWDYLSSLEEIINDLNKIELASYVLNEIRTKDFLFWHIHQNNKNLEIHNRLEEMERRLNFFNKQLKNNQEAQKKYN